MTTKMTRGSRTELAKTLRKRYLSATIKQKQTILKEFIAATGYHSKSAVRVLTAKLRRSARSRGHFPSDEAAMKLIWLQLREITQRWKMPPREWASAKAQFAIAFGDRFEFNR